jgi:hypothetical protein
MSKKAIWLAAVLVLFIAWSCKEKSAWKGSIETVDGVHIVRNPKTPMYPQGALELQEDLSIGAAEGAEEYMFVRLRGLAVDNQGAIYALDQRKPSIDVFSNAGTHLRSIGRRGQGPGEFQNPFFISLSPAEEMMVGEMGRLSYFDRSGIFLRSRDNSVQPLAFVKFLSNGTAVGTRMVMEEKNPRYEVVLCGPELEVKSVLASSRMPDPSAKYNLFASVIRWDLPGGKEIVCGSEGEAFRLDVFDADGRVVRRIYKDYDPVPVTDLDIDRQMKRHGFQSRDEVSFPSHLPPIWWVYADEDGRIYVSTWQRDALSGISIFNIFDPEGRYLCDSRIPGEPIVFKNSELYAIVEDADGIQYIKRYHMTWRN